MTLQIVLILALSIVQYEAAKIFAVLPTPSISHQIVFRPLTQELAKRGHEVIVLTADPAFPKGKTPANLTEIDVHDMSYGKLEELYKLSSSGDGNSVNLMNTAFKMLNIIFEMQLKTPEVQKLIKDEKFDLLILEACIRPTLILTHVFQAPVIQVSSFGFLNFNLDAIGVSGHPILYPSTLSQKLFNLTKWEKIVTLWDDYRLNNVFDAIEADENAMAKRMFGPNVPPIKELKNNVDMMFLNIHPIWERNRPVPPSVVYMWGIHETAAKELPKDLKNYLDSSKRGVIYMSLGTNVKPSLLPPEKVEMFVKVFSQLPYDVLWKWDKDELPGRSKNIHIAKWFPQRDLLRHPNVKVFITQGGLQSTEEAIKAGVPLIGIPMIGDQWYNVEQYVYHKIGVRLDIGTLQHAQLKDAIDTVISDLSYRRNLEHIREVMRDEPMKPLDRAVWWTEYVLRHGGAKHLRSPAANISWAQYLELELILIVLFSFVITLSGIAIAVLNIYQFIRRKFKLGSNVKTKNS